MTEVLEIDKNKVTMFCISVWWMHGWSAARIARATGLTERTVTGRLERRFHNPRAEIGVEGRQMILDELRLAKPAGANLPDDHFKALPLAKVQAKVSTKSKAGTATLTAKKADRPPSRKELARKRREAERRQKLDSEQGRAPRLLAPFELLIKTKVLADPADAPGPDVGTSGRRREEAGLKFRHYLAGTRIGGLKSLNYEGMSGGGNLGLPPSAFRLHCIATVGQLRELMSPEDFQLLENIVDRDEHVWDSIRVRVNGISKSDHAAYKKARDEALTRARNAIYEQVRRALDIVALYEGGLLSHVGFALRWGYSIPYFTKTAIEGAAEASRGAGDLLRAGRRK